MTERRYPLISWKRAAAFPLAGAITTVLMGLLVGSLEPSLEVTCVRAGAFDASCTATERTLFGAPTVTRFRLAETDVVRTPAGDLLLTTPMGAVQLGRGIEGSLEIVRTRLRELSASPASPGMTVRAGFALMPFVAMTPVMMLLLLVPAWGLGGTIVVRLDEGRLSVRRERRFVRGEDVVVTFPPGTPPQITAERLRSRRHRRQGVLFAERDGVKTMLALNAAFDVLDRITEDLRRDLRPGPPETPVPHERTGSGA